MDKISDKSIDLVLCDPPYQTTGCKWDKLIPFDKLWIQLNRVLKDYGTVIMTASQPFTTHLIYSNISLFKYCLVWEKSRGSNFVHAKFQPLKCHEDIVVFSKGGSAQGSKNPMVYNPQMVDGLPYDKGSGHKTFDHLSGGNTKKDDRKLENKSGKRYPRSVIYFPTAESEGKTYHPTQKPLKLMEYLINQYSNVDDTVLDFAMGSGTTGLACKNTNRNFIGIEKDLNYFNIANERINVNN